MANQAPRLDVESYEVELDLTTPGATCFRSRTVARFSCEHETLTVAIAAVSVESITLNGVALVVPDVWDGTRLRISGLGAANTLEVVGYFPYSVDDERGLRRACDPDGTHYPYCAAGTNAASRVFCCLDSERTGISLTLSTPTGWTQLINDVQWPQSASVLTFAAGPWSQLHRGVLTPSGSAAPLTVYAQRPRSDKQQSGEMIAGLAARSVVRYEHDLRVPYPFPKCDVVFVKDFVSLGYSAPGMIMLNDVVLDQIEARGPQYAATVISHEVAHSWMGNLVDFGADQWLVEACATYLSRTAVPHLVPGSRPWAMSDTPAPDAGRYAEDAELIRRLEKSIGRGNIMRGFGDLCRRFAFRTARPADLADCLSTVSGQDLASWPGERVAQPPDSSSATAS